MPPFNLWGHFLANILPLRGLGQKGPKHMANKQSTFGVKIITKQSLPIFQKNSYLSKFKQKLKKSQWSWFVTIYFIFNYFPGRLSMAAPDNNKQ